MGYMAIITQEEVIELMKEKLPSRFTVNEVVKAIEDTVQRREIKRLGHKRSYADLANLARSKMTRMLKTGAAKTVAKDGKKNIYELTGTSSFIPTGVFGYVGYTDYGVACKAVARLGEVPDKIVYTDPKDRGVCKCMVSWLSSESGKKVEYERVNPDDWEFGIGWARLRNSDGDQEP